MNFTNVLKFELGKKLPIILQTEASECALACMAMVASFHGHDTDLSSFRSRFPVSLKGLTLDRVAAMAEQLGMTSRGVKVELSELDQLQLPAILHWNMNHFVVLKRVRGDRMYIHDPASGYHRMRIDQVSQHFTGVALELAPGMNFRRHAATPPIALRPLLGRVVGLKRGLVQLLLLSLVVEAFSLLMPLLTQWITDEALVSANASLLQLLCFGMVAVGVINATLGAIRTWVGIYISNNFNMQWMTNVMAHMLRLPVEYFERRHIGDIVSRFQSVHTIQQVLTQGSIDILLDGILILGTIVMMFLYNPTLAGVSLGAVILYAALRWARFDAEKNAETGIIAKTAKEQTYFLETIRGVRSIKMFDRTRERRNVWVHMFVDAANARLVLQKLGLLFSTAWGFLGTFERAWIFWLGASAVIANEMSLGMLFAFISYKEQFSNRVNRIIDRFVDFKLLGISTERLADIVMAKPEEDYSAIPRDVPEDVNIEVRDLRFRYGADEPLLIDIRALKVNAGECVAIVGGSGCGKTTLLKLMQCVLQPTFGEVRLGGEPIARIGLSAFRGVIASVMQDDHLFAGSLYDNIYFLDTTPDLTWARECAMTANIHDEIIAMPMGYHTLVGDMGTTLSGGQKQRILLARALYRKPKILFLDEATSHLDVENERKIGAAIASLKITRIMVAHRPETIAIAERVITLENGRISAADRPQV